MKAEEGEAAEALRLQDPDLFQVRDPARVLVPRTASMTWQLFVRSL